MPIRGPRQLSLWTLTGASLALLFLSLASERPATWWFATVPMVLGPVIAFVGAERNHRSAWIKELPFSDVPELASYRTQAMVTGYSTRAPVEIRLAAASCFAFGIAFIPGLLLGLFGLLVMGVGLLSIPGLYVAHELWRAGHWLLQASFEQARRAAHVSKMFNFVLMVIGVTTLGLEALTGADRAWLVLTGVSLGYVFLSLAHAAWIESVSARALKLPA